MLHKVVDEVSTVELTDMPSRRLFSAPAGTTLQMLTTNYWLSAVLQGPMQQTRL